MTRKHLFMVAVVAVFPLAAPLLLGFPLAALAQGAGAAQKPGATPAPGAGADSRPSRDPERMEKRMRLARTLGLAEALDLDAPQALKLGETIARFDDRRLAARTQMREAQAVLRRAAMGEKVQPAEVDQAIQKALDSRAQLQAVDRETVAEVTKGLTPDKKARAVLFLSKFHGRFGPGMHGGGMGPGGMGPGMGPHEGRGRGPRRGGFGMGPGGGEGPMMGMGPPPPADWDDEE
jgi:hypothetical protein